MFKHGTIYNIGTRFTIDNVNNILTHTRYFTIDIVHFDNCTCTDISKIVGIAIMQHSYNCGTIVIHND